MLKINIFNIFLLNIWYLFSYSDDFFKKYNIVWNNPNQSTSYHRIWKKRKLLTFLDMSSHSSMLHRDRINMHTNPLSTVEQLMHTGTPRRWRGILHMWSFFHTWYEAKGQEIHCKRIIFSLFVIWREMIFE